MRHEEVLLEVAHRLEERLDRLGRALDDVLERRDPLEQVLVEGDLLLGLPRLLDDADAGEDEELGVAARAELLVVGVLEAADLAEHQRSRQSTVDSRQSWFGLVLVKPLPVFLPSQPASTIFTRSGLGR